jgi:4-amino-4-deoxy-L-arabinose transferase-like glycosyltransferase
VRYKLILALIILGYLFIGVLYAAKTPDWQVPDEPAHYNYVRQLAVDGRLPVLEPGDYDQDYLGLLTSKGFPPELSVDAVEYEDWQPPLYYALATPIYLLFNGALLPLRLFSLLLGAGVVLLAYGIATAIFPGHPLLALGTAAFVAFVPQHLAMMAGVNNDSLTELLIALALLILMLWLRDERRGTLWLVGLGVVLGLGLVTKASFAPVVVMVGLVLLMVWWREPERNWRQLFRMSLLTFGPAVLIAAPWWLRNVVTYGGFDIYGIANHDAVVVGQPRTADWIATNGIRAWLERWVTFTFQSFWGQFGWMGVLMPTRLYRALALWSAMLLIGFVISFRKASGVTHYVTRNTYYATRTVQSVVLGSLFVFVVFTYVFYNRTFVQHQGRYLFPALIPIAVGAALATDALLRLVRWPSRLRPLAFAAPYLGMAALGLFALWRFIIPALT